MPRKKPNFAGMSEPMPPAELTAVLDAIDWSTSQLGKLLNVDESTVRRWQGGKRLVPAHIADWLRTLAAFHAAHPPPKAPERDKRPGRPAGGSLWGQPNRYTRRTEGGGETA